MLAELAVTINRQLRASVVYKNQNSEVSLRLPAGKPKNIVKDYKFFPKKKIQKVALNNLLVLMPTSCALPVHGHIPPALHLGAVLFVNPIGASGSSAGL